MTEAERYRREQVFRRSPAGRIQAAGAILAETDRLLSEFVALTGIPRDEVLLILAASPHSAVGALVDGVELAKYGATADDLRAMFSGELFPSAVRALVDERTRAVRDAAVDSGYWTAAAKEEDMDARSNRAHRRAVASDARRARRREIRRAQRAAREQRERVARPLMIRESGPIVLGDSTVAYVTVPDGEVEQ
jgi:hypothetical protein